MLHLHAMRMPSTNLTMSLGLTTRTMTCCYTSTSRSISLARAPNRCRGSGAEVGFHMAFCSSAKASRSCPWEPRSLPRLCFDSRCHRYSYMTLVCSFIGSRGFLRRVLLVVGYPYDKIQKHSQTYTNLRNHTIKLALIQLLLFGYLGFRVWVVQGPSIPEF